MEQLIVTRADNSTYSLPGTDPRSKIISAQQKRVLMGEDVVTMEVESVGYVNFQIGDWIEVFGEKYTLNTLGEPERIGENLFSYNLTFEGVKYELTKVVYRSADWTGFNPTNEFPLTGTAEDFLTVMQYNLERAFGQGAWTIGTIPTTEAKTLSFNAENCLAVLNRLCEEFGTEYVISKSGSTYVINLQEAGSVLSMQLEYGRGKGLYSLTRSNVDSKNIITRLYAEGSGKNIKIGYRSNATRLQLPVNPYLDSDNQSSYGIIEGSKIFDDIFPHRTGEVTSLDSDEKTFGDSGMFDLNEKDTEGNTKWLIPGQSAKIHFNTGNLGGYEFEITSYDHATNTFKIKPYEDERGLVFPNPDTAAFQIQAGDKYVILDVIMPDSYVTAAENELQTRAQEYLNQNKQPRVEYSLSLDRFYLKDTFEVDGTLPNILQPGDYIHVVDTKIGVDKNVRVKDFTRLVNDPYEYEVTLSDVIEPSRIERLISDSVEAKKALRQNRMFDPARTRRNWRDIVEVTTMLDTLRAEVALIGSPAGQFQLTSFLQPNKGGNANQFGATAGQLVHDSYENPGTWNMSAFDVTLTDTGAYYLYAKCSRTTNAGVFLLSLTKIEVEEDPNYYHFPIGVLSSVNNDARTLTTTYGYTLISGNNISTGIIQNDASGIMINLETGEIRGAFTFTNGQLVEDAVNEKSGRNLGGTDPAVGWVTITEKRKHVNDIWAKTTDEGIEEYFYAETTTDNFEWVLNKTIIGPGRIETGAVDADMIDVTGLFAKEINATNFNLGRGTVGDFEVDSVLRSENELGQGIFIDPKERLITIEDKAEGAGISAVRMRGGALTPQAQIDGAASGTYETSVISSPYDIVQNSNELRAGYSKTLYFGKNSSTSGLVKASPYEPTGTERYSLVTGKNYAADFRYLFSIIHNGGSRNGQLHKLHGNLTVTVTSKLTGVKSDGSKVTLVEARSQVIEIERDDSQAVTNHPLTRKVNFSNTNCVAAFWEVGINLSGNLTYQQWTSEFLGKYWMTSESMDVDFEVAVNKFHSFYPSLGVTELTTSGFQTIWAQNRYFRIDGEADGSTDIFIESAGPWIHSGDFLLNGKKIAVVTGEVETDLSYYATKQYVQDGFISNTEAANFANKAGNSAQDFNVKDLIIHGTVNRWLEDVITVDDASLQLNAKQSGVRVNSGLIIYDNDSSTELSKLYYDTSNKWKIDGNNIAVESWVNTNYLGINDKAVDSDKLDGIDSSQFLRSDMDDYKKGGLLFYDSSTSAFSRIDARADGVTVLLHKYRSSTEGHKPYKEAWYNGSGYSYLGLNSSGFYFEDNVGIGTTSPTEALDVNGNILASGTIKSSTNFQLLQADGSALPYFTIDRDDTNQRFRFLQAGTGFGDWDIEIGRDTTNTILNGSIGIRVDTPSEALDVAGNIKATKYRISSLWEVGSYNNGFNIAESFVANARIFIKQGGDVGIGTASPSEKLDVNGNIKASGKGLIGSDLESIDTFISGFAGSNWKLEKDTNHLTVDNLTVRKRMDVYELVINKIRATNGSLWVSDSIKYDTVAATTPLGEWNCFFDTDNGNKISPFTSGDIVKAQKFTGREIKYFVGSLQLQSDGRDKLFAIEGEPFDGMECVRIGNTSDTNRQGAIYLTSSDSGSPYIDVLDGVTSADYSGKNKLRIGKLDGISGQNGYGIWGSRNGNDTDFVISSDGYAKIAGWNFDNSMLSSPNDKVRLYSYSSSLLVFKPDGGRISVGQTNNGGWTGKYGISATDSSNNYLFRLDDEANQIAGWNFNNETLSIDNDSTNINLGVIDKWSGSVPVYGFKIQNPNHRIMMHSYNDTSYGLSAYDFNTSSFMFQLGITNQIAGWNFDDKYLWNGDKYGNGAGIELQGGSYKRLITHADSNNWVNHYYYSSSDWGLRGRKNGSDIFQLGSTNQIAGVNFDDSRLWTANWELNKDGSATFTKGNIAGFTIENDRLYSANVDIDNNQIEIKDSGKLIFKQLDSYYDRGNPSVDFWSSDTNQLVGSLMSDRQGFKLQGYSFINSNVETTSITVDPYDIYLSGGVTSVEGFKLRPYQSNYISTSSTSPTSINTTTYSSALVRNYNGTGFINLSDGEDGQIFIIVAVDDSHGVRVSNTIHGDWYEIPGGGVLQLMWVSNLYNPTTSGWLRIGVIDNNY